VKPRRYNEHALRGAAAASTSIRQVLACLGLREAGGNYTSIKRAIAHFDIDTSHFTGKAHNRGKSFGPKRPLDDYLPGACLVTTHRLKQRLISEGRLEALCVSGGLEAWLGRPIPLELDHIDGNRSNCALTNLRLLCPNCHALTGTYRGKNRRRHLER